ncbi:ORF6 [Halorubrum pleomorphic virus 1]|uniref:Uncharacterized protein 6 n=1 Tax=Halorubrum pleomorphic virus 1 TaxID=634168 RepID=ORF6_HAPV1|nr:hypothetical protein HRPV-1_gp6 [Halorubrum pleomorphic virus 1]C1JJY5.1 RecName: Full=Uncharacterized protein 6; Flags: Precursor [Halorubrum pleomorphic virus 1]ACO54901.1 ORF6 [Halorubrum pleomorphic virus 1]
MNKKSLLVVLVIALAVVPFAATAQTTPGQNQTAPNSSSPTVISQVDSITAITDYELRDGDLWIQFQSSGGNTLSITETAGSEGATQVRVRSVDIPRGTSTVTIDLFNSADGSVLITSRLSLEQNSGTVVSVSGGSAIISGPFTASDAQASGLGAAISVASVTLLLVFRASRGESTEGERIA